MWIDEIEIDPKSFSISMKWQLGSSRVARNFGAHSQLKKTILKMIGNGEEGAALLKPPGVELRRHQALLLFSSGGVDDASTNFMSFILAI